MTTKRRFKRLVRERAGKTGESYTAALRHFRTAVTEEPPMDMSCSFCGKRKSQVDKLVAGPGVYICSECIQLAYEIISPESPHADDPTNARVDQRIREYVSAKAERLDASVLGIHTRYEGGTVHVEVRTSTIGRMIGARGSTAEEMRAVLCEITGRDVTLNLSES